MRKLYGTTMPTTDKEWSNLIDVLHVKGVEVFGGYRSHLYLNWTKYVETRTWIREERDRFEEECELED
jgi:hypothetical protein